MTNSEVEIVIASDCNYEFLCAEIYFKGKYVAQISQENGPDHLLLEFPRRDASEKVVTRECPLDVFLDAVELAKKRLFGVIP
ncbi:MAG: hypothetical protein H7X92_11795 [Chitinophagales bacterium]|nr:hypothetical protein [Hyphomicrobiales bacterium]